MIFFLLYRVLNN